MKNTNSVWPPAPTNQTPYLPPASRPLAGQRWGWISVCLVVSAVLLFTLVFFCHALHDLFFGQPGPYSNDIKTSLIYEMTCDGLLLCGYIAGRLGWQVSVGKFGAITAALLLLLDLPLSLTEFWRILAYNSH